jgi:hypothetical protein
MVLTPAEQITPPGQEGWTRHQEKVAKLSIMERTGWWFWFDEFFRSNLSHHPVCAFGAATPPGQEGQCRFFKMTHYQYGRCVYLRAPAT